MRCFTTARLLGTLICSLPVFGCTPGQGLALDGGIVAVQEVKDAEARVLKASICAMSIGAYYRINNALERRAMDALCGGLDGALASLDDLNVKPAESDGQ